MCSLTARWLRVPTPQVFLEVLRIAELLRAGLALVLLDARVPGHVAAKRRRRGEALATDLTLVPVLTVVELHVRGEKALREQHHAADGTRQQLLVTDLKEQGRHH